MSVSKKEKLNIVRSVDVSNYQQAEDYLQALYMALKTSAKLSHPDFSEFLGFSRTNNQIRLVVNGQRKLSNKMAEKISNHLELTGKKKQYFLKTVKLSNAKEIGEKEKLLAEILECKQALNSNLIEEKQLEYFRDWYTPVIREMISLSDGGENPEEIQKRLNFPLRLEQIKKSFELLIDMGVISKDASTGRYVKSQERLSTEENIDSMLVVRYLQKMMEMGQESILKIDSFDRSVEAITVSLSSSKIPIIKKKIETLLDEIEEMEASDQHHDDVYQVNIQLFPFTKKKQ